MKTEKRGPEVSQGLGAFQSVSSSLKAHDHKITKPHKFHP